LTKCEISTIRNIKELHQMPDEELKNTLVGTVGEKLNWYTSGLA